MAYVRLHRSGWWKEHQPHRKDMTDDKGKYKLPVNPEVWEVAFELPSYIGTNKTHIIVDAAERQVLNVSLAPVER